jgi:hypothetical protein
MVIGTSGDSGLSVLAGVGAIKDGVIAGVGSVATGLLIEHAARNGNSSQVQIVVRDILMITPVQVYIKIRIRGRLGKEPETTRRET